MYVGVDTLLSPAQKRRLCKSQAGQVNVPIRGSHLARRWAHSAKSPLMACSATQRIVTIPDNFAVGRV